jgi:hypothetical protein
MELGAMAILAVRAQMHLEGARPRRDVKPLFCHADTTRALVFCSTLLVANSLAASLPIATCPSAPLSPHKKSRTVKQRTNFRKFGR